MAVIFYLALLLLADFSRAEINSLREEGVESNVKEDKDENIAFESFGSPVYGINSVKSSGLNGKSAYTPPVPPMSPSYMAYLAGLGYGNSYAYGPYSRYGMLPYSYPSLYGYGSPLLNNPAFSSALLSGMGYAGYGNPYFGRSMLSGLGYGYSPYNMGYRFGGLGYPPAALSGAPVPVPAANAPVVPAAAPAIPAPVPRVPGPVPALPPPLPAVPNTLPAVPAPLSAGFPYRGPFRGKDGAVRYGYAPADVQALPVY